LKLLSGIELATTSQSFFINTRSKMLSKHMVAPHPPRKKIHGTPPLKSHNKFLKEFQHEKA